MKFDWRIKDTIPNIDFLIMVMSVMIDLVMRYSIHL